MNDDVTIISDILVILKLLVFYGINRIENSKFFKGSNKILN